MTENSSENCAPCSSKELTSENYHAGFLVDEELMAGVGQEEGSEDSFFAYVLRHSTGEYLGYQTFSSLADALQSINQIPRDWVFEKLGGCGEGKCGEGNCKGGKCAIKATQSPI